MSHWCLANVNDIFLCQLPTETLFFHKNFNGFIEVYYKINFVTFLILKTIELYPTPNNSFNICTYPESITAVKMSVTLSSPSCSFGFPFSCSLLVHPSDYWLPSVTLD
jgi:hypothetical protein